MSTTVSGKAKSVEVPIVRLDVSAFVVPTDFPEADGTLATPVGGDLRPDLTRLGMGLELKRSDAARFAV